MKLTLHVWRQSGPEDSGAFKAYHVTANPHMSFLEMLDVVNEELTVKGEEPIAFEHDCREGICVASVSMACATAAVCSSVRQSSR